MLPASVARAGSSRPTAASGVAANTNPVILTDPTGDNGTAPDITSLEVANDGSGYVGFRIGLAQHPTRSDIRVVVAIDSDRNPATGFEGTDYLLLAAPASGGYGLARWDGTGFVDTSQLTLSESMDATSVSFSVNRSELGNSGDFAVWARTVQGPTFAAGHYDSVPDIGSESYALEPGAALQLTVARSYAGGARAGTEFVASIFVTRSDVLVVDVIPGDVACTATVGTRKLAAVFRDALGAAAGCLWQLPKRSRGKLLRASVAVTLDGVTIRKAFVERIK